MRVCYGLDSQVALGTLVKGRAASKRLNSLLRGSSPNLLGSDLYGAYGFFPSALKEQMDLPGILYLQVLICLDLPGGAWILRNMLQVSMIG